VLFYKSKIHNIIVHNIQSRYDSQITARLKSPRHGRQHLRMKLLLIMFNDSNDSNRVGMTVDKGNNACREDENSELRRQ